MGALDGMVAIVTGAGSGNGLAIANAFSGEGCAVVIGEYSEERGTVAAEGIQRAGGRARFIRTDVSRWEDVDRLVGLTLNAFGPPHILVNNAGVLDGYATCIDTSLALFERVIAINLQGVFFGCKRVLPEMVKGGYGKIINIASVAGLQAQAGGTAYTAAKHGVVGLTRQLACEYGPSGIRVNALCPGPVTTQLRRTSAEVLGDIAPSMAGGLGTAPDEVIRGLIPLGFRGSADDVARAALFLASRDSDYINGHTLVLDGGLTAGGSRPWTR